VHSWAVCAREAFVWAKSGLFGYHADLLQQFYYKIFSSTPHVHISSQVRWGYGLDGIAVF